MGFTLQSHDGILIIKVEEKRATVEIAGNFKEQVLNRIEKEEPKIIVDLSTCDFVDSSFLGALVAILKRATLRNGDVKIVGVQPAVKDIFELTRLVKIFEIYDSLEAAIQSFENE